MSQYICAENILKTNGYHEVLKTLTGLGAVILDKSQKNQWANKDSVYGHTKDCEILLEGICIAELTSFRLKGKGIQPASGWNLVRYDGFPEQAEAKVSEYFV